ncbi:GMC family oxidoreductase N-terminal domain-containing protein [Actinophytocola sp.]|uniref:GMC family oxidoreductase N-terminal domain-containing protein n=1 Tax=Actinophytocola sp. TaxID=1872138 RepID=UPI00389A42B5
MATLARFCELVVPGSATVDPVSYVERALAGMSPVEEDRVHAALGLVVRYLDAPERIADTEGFQLLRALAIEAFYGDYAPPGHEGPTGHAVIGYAPPGTRWLRKDWTFLDQPRQDGRGQRPESAFPGAGRESAEVVVVGSGAGGGVIAAELARRGHDVLLIEAGGYHPAEDRVRFELAARHQLWWPHRATVPRTDDDEPVALLAGRCVGGTTVINTKVAMRAADFDVERFATETGSTLTMDDLLPWYARVEERLGVRVRADWTPSVHRVEAGFAAVGAALEPVRSYTDYTCTRCGACTTGCPTNAGRDALNTFLAPVLARDELRLSTHRTVTEVLLDGVKVAGVRYRSPDGTTGTVSTRVVVLAAGSLGTPQILLRSGGYLALDTPSTRLVGTTLGLHPARLVYGLFDEPVDCHLVYPITAHCLAHQRDFVVEGTTIQEPVSFATSMVDVRGRPLWGADLAAVVRGYRRWAGLLAMANDENTGTVELDPAGRAVFTKGFSAAERRRLDDALAFTTEVLTAAGARRVVWSGLSTSHVQGSARMGADPNRSVVDDRGRAHGVDGLYVGDGSVVPASLSVNPSLTIMALAAMIADNLAGELA